MFNDWQLHPNSANNYHAGITSPTDPPVGSVNAYRVNSSSDSSLKRLIYVNKIAPAVNGNQELQAVMQIAAGATDVRVGMFMMWDGVDFDETDNAFVMEISIIPPDAAPHVRLRKGTSRSSELLYKGPDFGFDTWLQLALQIKFDIQSNSEIRLYSSNPNQPGGDSVLTPVWSLGAGPIVVPRADALYSGQFGFFIESQQASFDAYIDHLVMNTVPTI